MKALYFYIPLFFVLLFAGQDSFAVNGNAIGAFQDMHRTSPKVEAASTNHTAILDVVVLDIEEEIHSGNDIKDDTAKTFAVKNTLSALDLKAVTLNSIVALSAAPVPVIAVTRIPSSPIYITNRVLRL